MIGKHDEAGQVVACGAQGVADPGPGAGEPGPLKPGGLQQRGLAVDSGLANHRMDKRDVIDDATECSDRVTEHLAAVAVRPEREGGLHPGSQPVLEGLDMFAKVRRLSVVFFESGFVVKKVDVAGGSGHEQLDHSLGARRVMQSAAERSGSRVGGGVLPADQIRQRDAAQAAPGLPEEVAARCGGCCGSWCG